MGNSKWESLSKEELINVIKEYSIKIGRVPKKEDMKGSQGVPITSTVKKCLGVETWKEALSLCGFETNIVHKHTEEFGLNKLKEYYNILNRLPMQKDFIDNNWKPHFSWYAKNFGSMKNALYKIGLVEKPLSIEERVQLSIEELRNIAKKLDKCPTNDEYNKFRDKGFEMSNLNKHLDMTNNEISIKYLPGYNLNKDTRNYTKEELLDILINLKEKLGHTPSWVEFTEDKNIPDYTTFNKIFNKTYNQILYEDLRWDCKIYKTDNDMLDDFYKLVKRVKRIPTQKDFKDEEGIYSNSSYLNRFGSMSNIFTLLDMDYNLFINHNSNSGVFCFDNKGNLCRSFIERYVNNLFIENGIEFQGEVYYSELLEKDKTRRRFDWRIKVDNKVRYVEYFGLYENKSKGDIVTKYKKKARRKIKDIYKFGKIENCIFLFPHNETKYRLICLNIKEKLEEILNIQLSETNNILELNDYSDMTNEMLLTQTMKYSDNDEYLPKGKYLASYNKKLYKEIKNRYGNLYTFAQISNKKVYHKSQGYYTKDIIFKLFDDLMIINNKIPLRKEMSEIGDKEFKFKGLVGICYRHFNGWVNMQLEYYVLYLEKHLRLTKESIKIIECIANKSNYFYNITEEQQNQAKEILNKVNNMVS